MNPWLMWALEKYTQKKNESGIDYEKISNTKIILLKKSYLLSYKMRYQNKQFKKHIPH